MSVYTKNKEEKNNNWIEVWKWLNTTSSVLLTVQNGN